MVCDQCVKEGRKCVSCEMKDMGFVQKSYVDDIVKNLHAEPAGTGTKDRHFNGDVDAFLDHTGTCDTPSCKKIAEYISKKVDAAASDAYVKGFGTSEKFSEKKKIEYMGRHDVDNISEVDFKINGDDVTVGYNDDEKIWYVVWNDAIDYEGNKRDLLQRYPELKGEI